MDGKTIKKRVSVQLRQQEYERLSRMAEESGRSLAGYLRWLLYKELRELEKDAAGG